MATVGALGCWVVSLVRSHDRRRHDDVIKWKHFPRYWPFVRGIHRSPVNSPHKGQWRGALMFTLICARINGWVNNRETGDLRRYRGHYDVTVMKCDSDESRCTIGLVFFGLPSRNHHYLPRWSCIISLNGKPSMYLLKISSCSPWSKTTSLLKNNRMFLQCRMVVYNFNILFRNFVSRSMMCFCISK